MNDVLETLLQKLDEPLARFDMLDRYYYGKQPLSYLAPEAREALGDRFGRMATNLPRLAVTALAERLRIRGFATNGDDVTAWSDWVANNLDQLAGLVHREALTLGKSYVIVWGDGDNAQATVESARQVSVLRDVVTREVVAGVKRWWTNDGAFAALYLPDKIVKYHHPSTGPQITGFKPVESISNPLGVVPVTEFVNGDRIIDEGVSEIDDLAPLVDALNKVLCDMLVSSEYVGRPRRWATGIELEEDAEGNPVNPIPEGHRAMISESADTKFGQLPGADLGAYESSVNVILAQIMAVSALPAHYVGVTTSNPASADALRASEASLTARAEARQAQFGPAWERVMRLLIAVRTRRNVNDIEVGVRWADASTRSIAQEADAVVKLVQAGILPATYALARLGYEQDEIDAIKVAKRAELFDRGLSKS